MLSITGLINTVIKWITYCAHIYLYKFTLAIKISLLCKKIIQTSVYVLGFIF